MTQSIAQHILQGILDVHSLRDITSEQGRRGGEGGRGKHSSLYRYMYMYISGGRTSYKQASFTAVSLKQALVLAQMGITTSTSQHVAPTHPSVSSAIAGPRFPRCRGKDKSTTAFAVRSHTRIAPYGVCCGTKQVSRT